ncbi:MAG: HAD-IA family hydrolase [Planctomycetes bacterium]|nr:HAD-IA family hydrolase [Planctomycetota bacterium]
MTERPQLFLFDMAGTTVRDDDHVVRAFERTARAAGLELDRTWLLTRMGWHKEAVFAQLLELSGQSTGRAPELARGFEDAIEEVFTESPITALPTALNTIRALDAAGIRVGFTTGFTRRTANHILAALDWQHYLNVTSDEVEHGRPAPDLIFEAMRRAGVTDVARVGTCGDTPADLEAGTNAGCAYVIGVGHGTHSLEALARYPHTHLFDDLAPVRELLEV